MKSGFACFAVGSNRISRRNLSTGLPAMCAVSEPVGGASCALTPAGETGKTGETSAKELASPLLAAPWPTLRDLL
jgi:hypothetical protein